ncbi:MAG: hypothetical protein IK147_02040, partial [Clostridia bacterium]|nr:hypothetical protein [Clostridia bacterium]
GIIDEEVNRIVTESLEKARKILAEHKGLLDNMARLLIERETIFTEEVDMLMEGKSVEEIMEYMDKNESTLSANPFNREGKNGKKPDDTEVKKENGNTENTEE